jgi:hypothetical protein
MIAAAPSFIVLLGVPALPRGCSPCVNGPTPRRRGPDCEKHHDASAAAAVIGIAMTERSSA